MRRFEAPTAILHSSIMLLQCKLASVRGSLHYISCGRSASPVSIYELCVRHVFPIMIRFEASSTITQPYKAVFSVNSFYLKSACTI